MQLKGERSEQIAKSISQKTFCERGGAERKNSNAPQVDCAKKALAPTLLRSAITKRAERANRKKYFAENFLRKRRDRAKKEQNTARWVAT